tara:strand:- start:58 stop:390 length:333 start_codon:yes stop_codon:yes gene_type:complete
MTDTISEFEKKLRKGKKFKKEETKGDIFRKKLKDSLKSKSSNGKNIKTMNIDKSLKNLKEDFRFPKIEKQKLQPPERGPMQPLAKGGRAGLKGGGICKKGMNRKAVGKNS